ncbi:MAG: type II toxin-antitoxin system VapC family toxin [Treponema sp.]|jgi:predicted nucleic acid-binding protein|nr:type II toxin-antitoxin system VapC family toxin [Treponema sp.]
MNKKLFVDSDIILDLLAERPLFYSDSAKMFSWAYKKKIELYTTAVVLANVFYILRKVNGNERSKGQIKDLRLLVKILPVNENTVDMALSSKFNDFEDGLQYYAAREQNLFGIITRNINDYRVKDIVIQTSKEFVKTNAELFDDKEKNKNG